ncbi:beta-ketoacyl synthase N-terminal-like domain-containing protein [Amycolatopsis sp. NPDC026612]|uniref:beta-ketoacyl synthase N-terminal-like domain-containing protein n=1 Tax=Amycolatopsis sp. NPDC026612 TaxID=3155466 RepID=UPI0033D1C641
MNRETALTRSQLRMWFMQAMDARRTDLTIACAARLTTPIGVAELQRRLLTVVAANPLLSATVDAAAGEPVWRSLPPREAVLAAVQPTLRAANPTRLRSLYAGFTGQPWDLGRDLPWSAGLVATPEATYLFCRFHHLVCDGDRSLELFLAGLDDRPPAADGPDLGRLVAEPRLPADADAEVARLAAAITEPGDLRRRVVEPDPGGHRWSGVVDPGPSGEPDEVHLLRRLRAATAHLVPGEQLLVAIPFDGCTPAQEGRFGYFGNPGIAVLPAGDGGPQWAEREYERACALAKVPFQHVMADDGFRTAVDPAHPFDVLLVPRTLFGHRGELVGPVSEPAVSRTPYALVLNHWRDGDGRLQVTLESTVVGPEVLDHLGARLRGVEGDRDGGSPPPPHEGPDVLERLAAVVEARADAVAVDAPGTGTVSYGRLWADASALADVLGRRLPPGRRVVAVTGRKHPAEIACVLGVNLAGATMLRLDRGPAATRRALAEVAGIGAVIRLPGSPVRGTGPDDELVEGAFGPCRLVVGARGPAPDPGPEPPLYITLTSGSTGQPKPIPFGRPDFSSLVSWHLRTFPGPRRTLQFSKLSFDIAYHVIYATLCGGGTLVAAGGDVRDDPRKLLEFLAAAEVEKVYLPTVLLRPVAESALVEPALAPPALKEVLVAGGSLRITPEIREWFSRTSARLVNQYGMSETQDVTSHQLIGPPAGWPDRPPAGLPVEGVEVRVVGGDDTELPPTLSGAVVVRRGAHSVVTGDVGFTDRDGRLHILGRDSRVIKRRGFRVNLQALEAETAAAAGVADAVAVHYPTPSGGVEIVVVATKQDPAAELDPAPIRDGIAGTLGDGYEFELLFVAAIPRLANHKPDLQAITELAGESATARQATGSAAEPGPAGSTVLAAVRALTGNPAVDDRSRFLDAGLDSISLMSLAARLGRDHPGLSVADFFRHPVIGDLQRALDSPAHRPAAVVRREPAAADEVAVVGLAGRFPGAPDVDTFWRTLLDGTSAVTAPADGSTFVRAQGHLTDVDAFDHAFFGISPAEARRMDPQVRVFLELCWTALEDAGEVAGLADKNVSVFAGAGLSTYLLNEVEPRRLADDDTPFLEHNTLAERIGTDRNYLTSTVSFRLGLTGPSVVVQAACATALTAVHTARRALLAGECDLALAGGVSIIYPQPEGYEYVEGSVRSRHGVCRPFDRDADGTVFGNGAGVVVLKRARDARTGGNTVYAEVVGSAVNHDGAVKAGFSAPNPESQTRLIDAALGASDTAADFVEAHGTGTAIGDVIEWNALLASRLSAPGESSPCLVGSVKGNVGHLDEAAGIAGFIKACLAVRYRLFPGTYGFSGLHPALTSTDRFTVTAESHKLPDDRPVRGGVSSFGMGGANCHVVVRSPAARPSAADAGTLGDREAPLYLPVSGRSRESLDALATRLGERLGHDAAQLPAASVVRTLTEGRQHFGEHRGVLVHGAGAPAFREFPAAAVRGETVWAFPGQGSGFSWDAVAGLSRWPVFAKRFPALLEAFSARLGPAVFDRHVGRPTGDPVRPVDTGGGECGEPCTIREQVLQFSFQLALVDLLRSFGCAPDVVTGHSLGEITAAVCAGLLAEPDALTLVAARCTLMDAAPAGFMAQVRCSLDRARALAAELDLDVAAVNGPAQVVLAGPRPRLEELRRVASAAGVHVTTLPVGKPFHSRMLAAAAGELERGAPVPAHPASVAFVGSNAAYGTTREPDGLRYWTTQLTSPVDFLAAAEQVLGRSPQASLVVEIGFSATLSRLVRAAATAGAVPAPELACDLKKSVPGYLGKVAAAAYRADRELDWNALNGVADGELIPLPSYPFDRTEIRPLGCVPRRGPLGDLVAPDVPFTLAPSDEDWIRGHRVGDRWVVPAAGILRLFARIGRAVRPDATDIVLADVSFERPIVFEAETDVVEARISVGPGSPAECVLSTRQPGQAWTRNAAALLTGEVRTLTIPHGSGTTVAAAGLYRRFEEQGLHYGAGYRGLTGITAGPASATALWRPAEARGDRTRLGIGTDEVAAVDGVLQLADVLAAAEDVRMPAHVAWARLRAVAAPAGRVAVGPDGPATVSGTLAGETGGVVTELAGVRFQGDRRGGEVAHRLGWRPHVPVGAELPDPVAAALDEARAALSAPDGEVEQYQRRIRELEDHAVRVLDAAGGREYLAGATGTTPADARRLRAFGNLLDRPRPAAAEGPPEGALDAERAIVENCAGRLPRFFDGSLDGESILFGGSGAARLRSYYQGSFLLNRLNSALAGVVASVAAAHSGRPLKVLEVGGGTGATTEGVLAALGELGAAADYTFTDLSEGLNRLAAERFGHHPGFRTATADLDSDESVGALDDDFDVVVAVDVVHATRDVGATLDRLAGRLAPHGVVLLVEDLKALAWIDLTFGLLDSWWSFDDDTRVDHPLLTEERWRDLLGGRFGRVDVLRACGGLPAEDVVADEGLFVCANPRPADRPAPVVVDVGTGADVEGLLPGSVSTAVLRFDLGEPDADAAGWYAAALLRAVRRAEELPELETLVLCTPDGDAVRPAGAMAAALARVAASEDRRVRTLALAVDGHGSDGETVRQVNTLLTHGSPHVNARICDGKLLLPAVEPAGPAPDGEPLDHDALVVFGGSSDLAHAVAEWFATAHGIGRVWLVGRTVLDEDTERFALRLGETGVQVRYLTADVGDAAKVREVAERVTADSAKPLVLNLAAVLRDGTIDTVRAEDLEAVLRPKVRGSHHLRTAFAGTAARFVLFSSTSVLLGNAGQAAHGMACGYLDGLAASPDVVAVQWGPWDGVGITARRGLNAVLRRAGENPLPAATLLPLLDRACRTGEPLIAADLSAAVLRRHPFRTAVLPALPRPAAAPDAPGTATAVPEGGTGDQASDGAGLVAAAVASVLGVAPGELAADRSLADNGVDSLNLIEVRAVIERRSGVRVPLNDLSDAPTLAAAAEAVRPRVAPAATGPVFYVAGIFGRLDGAPDLESALTTPGGLVTLASPTRAAGEPGRTDVVEVAGDLADQVERAQPEGELTLVGHSFGAMVACSLAVELRRRGRTLRRLVVVDGEPVATAAAGAASEEEFANLLELGGGASRLSGDSRASAYEIYRANCEIARSPQVVDELACPIVIAVPETATGVGLGPGRAAELAAEAEEKLGGTSVAVVRIPGDHFSMLRSPHVTRLAEHLE